MSAPVDVAIVGAGPYGLSLAAHLNAAGIQTRVFGRPMDSWRSHMPEGMLLKSDPFASSLSDPQDFYTLARFSEEQSIPYSESEPVRLDLFCNYGLAFQKRCAPRLAEVQVSTIERSGSEFIIGLDEGGSRLDGPLMTVDRDDDRVANKGSDVLLVAVGVAWAIWGIMAFHNL